MDHPWVFAKSLCIFNEWWMKPLLNWNRSHDVRYTRKIRYDPGDPRLYLNLCQPKERTGGRLPVFVYIHGGGWVSGRPEHREGFVSRIAEAGCFTMNVFYGLSPRYHHPLPIENLYKALAWLVRNAGRYDIDMTRIFVGGESAGAHLAAALGSISSNPEYRDRFNLPEESRNLRFSGLVLNCGVYDMEAALNSGFPHMEGFVSAYYGKPLAGMKDDPDARSMSPGFFATRAFPRSFVITAAHDTLCESGREFADQLDRLGVECRRFHGTGLTAVHGFAVAQVLPQSRAAMSGILGFLKEDVGR